MLLLLQGIGTVLCPGQFSKQQSNYYLKHKQKFLEGFAPPLIINVIHSRAKAHAQKLPGVISILCDKLSWYLWWTLLSAFPTAMSSPPFHSGS